MPFKSKAQRAWMYKNKPAMAKRWEKETPKGKKLPKHVSPRKRSKHVRQKPNRVAKPRR